MIQLARPMRCRSHLPVLVAAFTLASGWRLRSPRPERRAGTELEGCANTMSTPSEITRLEDWDEASHVVSDAYFPHALKLLSPDTAERVTVHHAQFGPIRVARIGFGADVSIASEHPGAYGINIPLAGRLESVTGKDVVASTEGLATVCPPDTPTLITRWTRTCEIVGVKIDRDYLHREMERILGRPGRRLPPQVDLTTAAGASWLTLVRSVSDQLLVGEGIWHNPLVAEQLSGAVTTAFVLLAVPQDQVGVSGARPRIVKRVLDRIYDDPAHPWTPGELAEIAGVSVRRLQEGFRAYVGMSPREYLLDVRLERVHEDLKCDEVTETVADVAMRWGLMHTGRFAAAYRRKSGVAPSEARER